ncbi:MAG: hypothetical protein DMF78_21840 [Acidobacteria bacterium]|nr:MAG: hypothetical protein DMF78_21840 [Acidobacteriota bacterium]
MLAGEPPCLLLTHAGLGAECSVEHGGIEQRRFPSRVRVHTDLLRELGLRVRLRPEVVVVVDPGEAGDGVAELDLLLRVEEEVDGEVLALGARGRRQEQQGGGQPQRPSGGV